jgi:hypothetical protein
MGSQITQLPAIGPPGMMLGKLRLRNFWVLLPPTAIAFPMSVRRSRTTSQSEGTKAI